jgi:N-acetylglucosaminyl-diphospho-decaprenol L-rhamnosyltransferase
MVAAVVVTHDTRDDAIACVGSLHDAGADEIVVVDSGSHDRTAEVVRTRFPDAQVVETGNVGFGRAANIGVERTTAPTVIIANADTRFRPGSAAVLTEIFGDSPDVGAVGPLVRYPDGRVQASARRLPTLGQAVGHALFGRWWEENRWTRAYLRADVDPRTPEDVDWVSGCAIVLRRRAFDDVSGFDPRYFMFVEDVDLGYRLRARGWRVRFSPAVEVFHEVGGSRKVRPARMIIEHARSLDRFYGVAYAHGAGRLLRPFIRVGLVAWTVAGIVGVAAARLRSAPDGTR